MYVKSDYFDIISNENEFKGLISDYIESYGNDNVVFVCVGSMKAFGDSVAPRIGSKLVKLGIKNVYGTEENPVHAKNLSDTIEYINENHTDSFIIAIDACLARYRSSVGKVLVTNTPLKAGAGVGKVLPEIGDITIGCMVDTLDNYTDGGIEQYRAFQSVNKYLLHSFVSYVSDGLYSLMNSRELCVA